MSTNTELAAIFAEIAAILELTGANRFRVNAHSRVARVLKDLTVDVSTLADDAAKLTAIEGIGTGTAAKIIEFVQTGRIAERDELLREIPAGLLDVMQVPGLGPKTVKILWEQAEVVDLRTLRKAIDSGALESLPRMGARSVQNIREALEFLSKASGRVRLGQALPIAEEIIEHLTAARGATRLELAGSLRRGCETIGDIDILASTSEPEDLSSAFQSMEGISKVLAAGSTKTSVRLERGLQVDLRVIDEPAFGAAWMYFTGSKAHNVLLRERAVRKKLRLNEYGLFPDDGVDEPPQKRGIKPIAAATESEVYEALGLPWIPPELREDRGELQQDPPELIALDDIRAELHAHTTASDGHMSIEELARQAKARGYHTVAVTDHSRSSVQANGLSESRLRAHIEAVREVDEAIRGIRVLAGSEVDILADGRLDYDDDLLAELDIVVASPHVALRQEPAKATKRLLAAIRHPLVHIIGHPTGRMIHQREGLNPRIDALIDAAVEHDTALEINANPLRLDLRDLHVLAGTAAGALIAIDTDAHRPEHLDYLRYGVLTARRGRLTADRCINTWTARRLHRWLGSKR